MSVPTVSVVRLSQSFLGKKKTENREPKAYMLPPRDFDQRGKPSVYFEGQSGVSKEGITSDGHRGHRGSMS